jgi:hypothetical protein
MGSSAYGGRKREAKILRDHSEKTHRLLTLIVAADDCLLERLIEYQETGRGPHGPEDRHKGLIRGFEIVRHRRRVDVDALGLVQRVWSAFGLKPHRQDYELELRRSVREGHPLVEMVVIPQNTHIGHRNIHYLRPGSSGRVGSGRSMFLVYFVPVPRRMAILRYDGRSYSFVPLKSDLFPGVSAPVSDCLGKSIPACSLHGYRFTIIFRKFLPPLEQINRLMRSTRPGAPKRLPTTKPGPQLTSSP